MLCDAIVCSVIYLFPLRCLFLVDSETTAGVRVYDYGVDGPSLLLEQPGKPPLDHQISPILLYTLALE